MKKRLKDKELLLVMGIGIIYCIGLIVYAWYSSVHTDKNLLGFRFELPFAIGSVCLFIGSLFVIWLIYIKKAELHNIYLGMSVVVFSLFLWAQPAGHSHDIQFHFDSAYALSNKLINQDTEVLESGERTLESYYRRECDDFMNYTWLKYFINYYADMQSEMFADVRAENTQLIEVDTYQGEISVPLYFYLPQAAGFAIARLLELNMFWLLYLGRLCICIACVILTYFAIKNIPFGKELLLLCGLIPTTILSYASLSRDALILAVSFYFTSKCLQLTYGSKKKRWWDYCLLFLSLILLVPYKLVYIPFILLLSLLIYKNCKEGIWSRKYTLAGAGLLLLVVIIFIAFNFKELIMYIIGINAYSMGEDSPFTVPYILANPGRTIGIVARTLVTSIVRYYANMIAIGDYGGGIHKEMVVIDTLFIIILVLLTNKPKKDAEQYTISPAERLIMVLTWVGVSGMVILAFLLCTPYTNDVIIGVQGRYFTPILPLMIFSFCSIEKIKAIKNKYWVSMMDYLDRAEVKRGVLLGIYGLSIFVVVNMYVYVVNYVVPG